MKLFRLTVILSVLLPFAAFAQMNAGPDTLFLTLDDAIRITQQNSSSANLVEQELLANHWRYRSFRASLFPSLNFSGSAPGIQREIEQVVQDDGSVQYRERQQGTSAITTSILQRIPMTGGTLFLSSSIERINLYSTLGDNLWRANPLFLGITQPIMEFNALKWNRRIEPLQYESSKKQYLEEMAQLATEVTGSFFDVYIAQINLDLANFNVAINDTIYTISQGRYNVGNIAENELLQTELALMNARTDLERARLAYDRAQDDLRLILSIRENRPVRVQIPERIPDMDIDVAYAVEQAKQNRSDMLDYQIERLQSQRNIARIQAESRLSTTLTARLGYNQTSNRFENLYDNPLNNQFVDVTFDIPIFRWGEGKADREAAYANHESILNSVELREETFIQEVEYQVREFLLLQRQIVAAATADTIATRRFEVSKNRYLIGKIDITNLLIAQQEKDSERRNFIRTLKEYWQGYYNLRRITLYDFERNQSLRFDYKF